MLYFYILVQQPYPQQALGIFQLRCNLVGLLSSVQSLTALQHMTVFLKPVWLLFPLVPFNLFSEVSLPLVPGYQPQQILPLGVEKSPRVILSPKQGSVPLLE